MSRRRGKNSPSRQARSRSRSELTRFCIAHGDWFHGEPGVTSPWNARTGGLS